MGSKVNVFLALFLCMVLLHSSSEVASATARQLTAGGLSHISSKEAAQTHDQDPPGYPADPCPPYVCN
ncbi:hypothetical protein ACS0TY_003099 [Phlomoides rotata]